MRTTNIALRPAVSSVPALQVPFPLMVAFFCLLWSSAFSVAKLAIADCPPLLVLTARFLLAGVFVLGVAAIFGPGGARNQHEPGADGRDGGAVPWRTADVAQGSRTFARHRRRCLCG